VPRNLDDGWSSPRRLVRERVAERPLCSLPLDEQFDHFTESVPVPAEATKNPAYGGAFLEADDGIRTHDLLHGKQTL
jgi:hypothetical protein